VSLDNIAQRIQRRSGTRSSIAQCHRRFGFTHSLQVGHHFQSAPGLSFLRLAAADERGSDADSSGLTEQDRGNLADGFLSLCLGDTYTLLSKKVAQFGAINRASLKA